MTATCSLCLALIDAPGSPVLGQERQASDWRALGERMARHVAEFHPAHAKHLAVLTAIFSHCLVSLWFMSAAPEFESAREASREILLRALSAGAELSASDPWASPNSSARPS